MGNKITFPEAEKILQEGFPEREDLKRFPYGEFLYKLWCRNDEVGEEYRIHGPRVLEAMNILLSPEPNKLIKNATSTSVKYHLDDAKSEIGKYFERFDEDAKALFRLAALYHDIGKYIIKERHPTIGWYTMEHLNPDEKDGLRILLGNREDYLQLLLILIRDHDEFGVLSTGEASYPILLRAATSLGNRTEDQKRVISAVMWTNLADLAGVPGLDITHEDFDKVIGDWGWFLKAIDEYTDKGRRLEDHVIIEASMGGLVEERITRLLLESSRNIPGRLAELRKMNAGYTLVSRLVHNQLQIVYPTPYPRRDFNAQFTHICKLDYGKRFFERLVEYCEGPFDSENIPALRRHTKERVSTEKLIYTVLAILRRMTSTYLAMERIEGSVGYLIGVEMKDLTPSNAPEKTAQISELLLQNHYPGLSWMMSDCLAWYF